MNNLIQLLPSRHVILIFGTVTAVLVMILLILIEYRITWRMLMVSVLSMVCTLPGGVFGQIARKLTYGEWLDMSVFVGNISEYEGTHYIGRAIYTAAAALILWRLIMRGNKGTFAKNGQDRFLSILSVFMLIQIIIGRIGCIKEGCCYGKAYYGALSVTVVSESYRVMPAVQTEIIISLITLAAVIVLYKKRKSAFPVFCIGYGTALFAAEFMYDNTGTVMIAELTAIQILAIALAAVGGIYTYGIRKKFHWHK